MTQSLAPGSTLAIPAPRDLTLRDVDAMSQERITVKMRKQAGVWEVEVHEDRDGYGVNAYGVDPDIETATLLAFRDLGEMIEDAESGTSVDLPARHHDRDGRTA